ncbi:hypothetical protein L6452_11580 [Arctium lappa]|uniref:Uncharacterized protein n=1 Tax=Arctium lappa TaxID=4217 RepID=A0ACB9DP75_ARCLA|nr:hypothetical protein L6452_11580 [Arctium lappa]
MKVILETYFRLQRISFQVKGVLLFTGKEITKLVQHIDKVEVKGLKLSIKHKFKDAFCSSYQSPHKNPCYEQYFNLHHRSFLYRQPSLQEKMNRAAPYADAGVNRYAASQLLQMSTQRMQPNAQISDFPGQTQFPSRADARQQWDTTPQIELNPMSPPSYSQGLPQERMANQKLNYENEANNDPRLQSYEQDMEVGYEDDKTSEITFQGLEQKYQDEIMKLIKELSDVEDEENARHKERIVEINRRYEEKLSSLRVHHAARVGEFLRKESQARLHQYQQQQEEAAYLTDPHDHGWPRPYGTMPHRDHHGAKRSQGPEPGRVPYPHGRVYNNSGAHY